MGLKNLISLIVLTFFVGLSTLAHSASGKAVMLEIIEGDTAFMVDKQAHKAWWIVGECRRPIPLEGKPPSGKNSNKSMSSKVISEDVTLGSRHITLEQQFRFNLAITPASVEVYNSMRGGWSSVPVQVNETCAATATCRSRMELPEC
jgi:hypothetical protein